MGWIKVHPHMCILEHLEQTTTTTTTMQIGCMVCLCVCVFCLVLFRVGFVWFVCFFPTESRVFLFQLFSRDAISESWGRGGAAGMAGEIWEKPRFTGYLWESTRVP